MENNEIALQLTLKAMEMELIEIDDGDADDVYVCNTNTADCIYNFYNDICLKLRGQ